MSKIRGSLEGIGAISPKNVYQFASRTRDAEIPVYRDSVSGVIFIDEFYVGDDEYKAGTYRDSDEDSPDLEDYNDTQRRTEAFRPFYTGKKVVDYGCGRGSFLRSIERSTLTASGVELQENFREALEKDGIRCVGNLDELMGQQNTVFMFHVLEHLPDPLSSLREIRELLHPVDGTLIVEVPNANDLLINQLSCEAFIEFTLWSQHLVLHTRDSLRRLLLAAGFSHVEIIGVQRYSLANHLTWLSSGKPGGHKSALSILETASIKEAYELALASQDSTDTIIAIANR